ncbi:hypothetical protein Tco_0269509 [Tanacetum coccineum]
MFARGEEYKGEERDIEDPWLGMYEARSTTCTRKVHCVRECELALLRIRFGVYLVKVYVYEVIMEYLVKISKKTRILELKRRHLKIIVLTSNMPYPSRKIRHICACTSLKTTKEQNPIRLYYMMDNLNITMEEYIRLEEEKAHRHGIMCNWETARYDFENDNEKVNMPSFSSPVPTVSYFDDLDFLKDFENEFRAIVYNDALTSKLDSSTEPVEISHRIDEFDLKN